MSSQKKLGFVIAIMMLTLLAACNDSAENKLIGSWKAVVGDKTAGYMEINEERYTNRSAGENPLTAEYILTENQDDGFILELINPETGSPEFAFEGVFENKNKITILGDSEDASKKRELIRVNNIAEEIEKDEKVSQKQIEKEEKERMLKEVKDNELAKEEAKKLEEEEEEKKKELAKEEEKRILEESNKQIAKKEETNQQAVLPSGSANYSQKADDLENRIMNQAKELFGQDMQPGFYGQYYSEWDNLLNEIWNDLKERLSQTEFEQLKQEQRDWIQMKEQNFAEIPDEPASERARGIDYLAFETKDRTFYLIETYFE